FYNKVTGGHLAPVLDLLRYIHHETSVWLEITTLLIPGLNDSGTEIAQLSQWISTHLGTDVPLHFSAFHPDFKMLDLPPTPKETLSMARRIAMDEGLRFVYTGNVHDPDGGTTFCPECHSPLIIRDWFSILSWNIDANGRCAVCHQKIP
ncbi:radical SAM domain-containing protein, partial [mine drainage metagenome]